MSHTPKRQPSPDEASSSIDTRPTKKRSRKRLAVAASDPTHAGAKIRTTSVRVKTNTGHVSVRKTKSTLRDLRPDATPATADVAPLEGKKTLSFFLCAADSFAGHLQDTHSVALNLDDDQGGLFTTSHF
jgi:hypothetical protein